MYALSQYDLHIDFARHRCARKLSCDVLTSFIGSSTVWCPVRASMIRPVTASRRKVVQNLDEVPLPPSHVTCLVYIICICPDVVLYDHVYITWGCAQYCKTTYILCKTYIIKYCNHFYDTLKNLICNQDYSTTIYFSLLAFKQ